MSKKTYDNPTMQVIALRAQDIVRTSNPEEYGMEKNIFHDEVYDAW